MSGYSGKLAAFYQMHSFDIQTLLCSTVVALEQPADEVIREILAHPRRIAVVGCSPDSRRDSYRVARLLIEHGHDVVPVNPHAKEILGRCCYASLADVPGPVDMVDVFRRSEHVAQIVEEAIEKGAKIVWTQLGVGDDRAGERGRRAGLTVIMDRCPAIEYRRLFPAKS
jgi:predicted CoA-binding protein